MKKYLRKAGTVFLTLTMVTIAAFVLRHLWDYYTDAPWTRDGRVSADVVQLAPDISGLVTQVHARENQVVARGQLLFEIDRSRYEVALQQAENAAASQRASLKQLRREAARNRTLSDLVAREASETGDVRVEQGKAALASAENAIALARINLERTTVRSPVDGYLSDHVPRPGEYVNAGHPVLSLVDLHSFHVVGYFEETKLGRVQLNQRADVRIMGESRKLAGHVQSIAAGIEDRDRSNGASLLPNVNPTFNWVRLAQRIPVRIALDEIPADSRLIAGRTATVSIREGGRP